MSKNMNQMISPVELFDTLVGSSGNLKNYGYHKEVTVGGKKCVAIIIGSHRYLVAVENVISSIPWYTNTSDDLSEIVPYTKGKAGAVTTAEVDSPVCNYSDYNNLDKLTQDIISAASVKSVTTGIAATAVRECILGGLRWNLPNFEVMYYMFKNYDTFFNPSGTYKLGNNVFWLPYSQSVAGSWGFGVNSSSAAVVVFTARTGSVESCRALPVSLF